MTRHQAVAVAALVLVVASTVVVEAQTAETQTDKTQSPVKLNLTEEQRETLKSLDDDMKSQLDDIRTQVRDGDLSRDQARTLSQGIRGEFRAGRQSVLTAEQLQVIEERRANGGGGNERGQGRGQDRGPGRGGSPFADLDLSQSQNEQLQSMREEHRSAVDALRESGEATPEDFQQLRQTQRQEIGGILTDEQRQQLDEKRARRESKGEGRRGRRGGGGRRRGGGRSR